MIRTASLRLRNRLAEIVVDALSEPSARSELRRLVSEAGALEAWAPDASGDDVELTRARAARAVEALAGCPLLARDRSLDQALTAAACLFDAGLHFEVHEVLEPLWVRADGPTRQALQGLIQIAVGCQHLANGNVGGARALLAEGGDRARGGRLADLTLDGFAAAAVVLARSPSLAHGTLPRFPRREAGRTVERPAS